MQRIERLIRHLKENQFKDIQEIQGWQASRAQYKDPGEYQYKQNDSPLTIRKGDWLANSGTTIFLEKEVDLPEEWIKDNIGIVFKASGKGEQSYCEALVSIQGFPIQGLDRNRDIVVLPPAHLQGEKIIVQVELFNPVGIPQDNLRGFNQVAPPETDPPPIYLEQSNLVHINREVQNLLYTLELYREVALLLDKNDTRRNLLIKAMNQVVDKLGIPSRESLMDASLLKELEEEVRKDTECLAGFKEGTIRAIGQSHIDTAWLWPIKETVRKASRTFSSVCTLLDEYKDFKYAQSQPQLFAYIKEYHPKIYARIKEKIAEGRFEIIGGMWVEPDLNIPSGESLVRQLLYGKLFYKEEFGVESSVEWLPDTFGYCASLPQILKKADTDYFMTTKLNWNDTNRFPYDLFYWEGIDGTKVLSYLHTILGQETHVTDIKNTWADFKQKNDYPERMLVYGYGDGGGGVTREMIERLDRSASLPGLPNVQFDTVHGFFERTKKANPNLPTWFGDLYLELHRGTYTSQAETKKNNRKAESLYRDLEIWNSFAYMALGKTYPSKKIKEGWKLLLLNQFHDIVPGTSISEVYELSKKQYQEVFEIGNKVKKEAINYIAKNINTKGLGKPIILFNNLNWKRNEVIRLVGGNELLEKQITDRSGNIYKTEHMMTNSGEVVLSAYIEDIPEMGYKTVWLEDGTSNMPESSKENEFNGWWETPFYQVEFNTEGWISRLYDKLEDKEIIKEGEVANKLQLFNDLPTDWDAWDIDPNFENQPAENSKLISKKITHKGSLSSTLKFIWEINQSVVSQEIVFYQHSRRIDFNTKVDWQEEHKLLKVAFPVNVHASKATYEIPFGSVERSSHNNTSWEQAQYEVCGQRWVDVSEGNYGVSLLNDSKYGFDIKGNKIRLSLLRAPKWPDENADIMIHEFTYSLFPHEGDWRKGKTVKQGHELNSPITVHKTSSHSGSLPNSMSFIETESNSTIIDSVKLSENGDGLILRLYESEGSEAPILLRFNFDVGFGEETNLLERPIEQIPIKEGIINRKVKPYEICTVHVKG
ncbi:hypothetical protein CIL05_00590 [Virgibacillus profundi]|uniref:Glycoside hydrolase family 38 central domain-containing protein n=1 Tax=Virgibacillus profundi TaxID=2024555 RepID=A0A2A2II27_9BACI|nr:alpha-mannosidase [Virgibacillus profundi]PAV31192.1 hypothetical protein CIL05_00590 [Virgibacillus profundi]PXY55374.1 alpha-mannosidase [Virgibacillus profundi]